MSQEIQRKLQSFGLLPVLRAESNLEAHALVEALWLGGVTVIEITMTVPNAIELMRDLKTKYRDLLLGAGTVLDAQQASAAIEAGAEFVVSPSFHPEVILRTRKMGKVSIPGALTPTEVVSAWNAGADFVKIFPCSAVGGPGYLRALKAPFPQIRLIPTGGVTLETAAHYLRAGAAALGVGTDLVNPAAISQGRPESITQIAQAYLTILQRERASGGPLS